MTDRPRQLQAWERALALLAAVVALALNVAAAIELFAPQATFGYQLVYTSGFEVTAVDAGTPALRAGIVAGDHLDLTASSLRDRILALDYQPARPGESINFMLLRAGRARPVTLQAQRVTASQSQRAIFSPLASFLRLAGFIYIAVALVILLRRPNRMTWGLFLYLVSATNVSLYRFPEKLFLVATFASDVLSVAGTVGLVIFAVRFPNDRADGWRRVLDRLAIAIGVLFLIPNIAWDATSLFAGQSPAGWMSYGSTLGALTLICIAGVALAATYLHARPGQRQRLQWVIAGVFFTLLSYASDWAKYWSAAYPLATSDAVVWTATVLYAFAPFALAYAVARQRVFEISFIMSRTLVYTIVTATVFGLLALVEWLVARFIERTGIELTFGALAAVAIAFSIQLIYARAEQFVDRTLFRRRHQAERHLARVAEGLPYAQDPAVVKGALLDEPVHVYALDSAELFARNESGDFVNNGKTLDHSVSLQLQGRHRALRLHETDSVLAIPIFLRSRLQAVAVYGAHVNGEDVDPDEVASLEALGAAAGIAYDHLEAARVERFAARWRRVAERQACELAALRARNGPGAPNVS